MTSPTPKTPKPAGTPGASPDCHPNRRLWERAEPDAAQAPSSQRSLSTATAWHFPDDQELPSMLPAAGFYTPHGVTLFRTDKSNHHAGQLLGPSGLEHPGSHPLRPVVDSEDTAVWRLPAVRACDLRHRSTALAAGPHA